MAEIRMERLKKRYGKDAPLVVDGVDLVIEEGAFVALLGPSGCGKTTILRMIAGLEPVTSGELWFDGRRVNDEPPDRRSVGMVFQNYALYPHMTVQENLSFGLKANRAPKAEIGARVEEVAGLLGLQELLGRRPKALSGGQRQRVALGRALMRRPEVFLMDEPLSNLDANLRERMRMELARLHAKLKITTVYVTHDQGEALTLADRVVLMDGGRVRQAGTAAEVYGCPADTFVAGFVGSPGMNLWTLPWEEREDDVWLGGGVLRLPRTHLATLESHGPEVTVGIRPEDLHLAPVSDGATVTCRVVLVEHLGSHTQLHAEVEPPGASPIALVARLDAGVQMAPGDHLVLGARAGAVHLFEATSGRRIVAAPAARPPVVVS